MSISTLDLPLRAHEELELWGDGSPESYELARDNACRQTDTIADWLSEQCCTDLPYTGYNATKHLHDAEALCKDKIEASSLSTPELLALAIGLTPYPKARLLAMDELARRVGVPQ